MTNNTNDLRLFYTFAHLKKCKYDIHSHSTKYIFRNSRIIMFKK
jgi:hypothetical protein